MTTGGRLALLLLTTITIIAQLTNAQQVDKVLKNIEERITDMSRTNGKSSIVLAQIKRDIENLIKQLKSLEEQCKKDLNATIERNKEEMHNMTERHSKEMNECRRKSTGLAAALVECNTITHRSTSAPAMRVSKCNDYHLSNDLGFIIIIACVLALWIGVVVLFAVCYVRIRQRRWCLACRVPHKCARSCHMRGGDKTLRIQRSVNYGYDEGTEAPPATIMVGSHVLPEESYARPYQLQEQYVANMLRGVSEITSETETISSDQ